MRVSSIGSAFPDDVSSDWISFRRSAGAIRSGLNLTCSDALAGQISVTPLMRLSLIALQRNKLLKKASSDISSFTSTKMCSSPPKEYRAVMGSPFRRSLAGRAALSPASFRATAYEPVPPRPPDGGRGPRASAPSLRHPPPGVRPAPFADARGRPRAAIPDDQLTEKRIVERRNRVAEIKHRIETHPEPAGDRQSTDRAGRGARIRAPRPRR